MKLFLDTDVIINVLKKKSETIEKFKVLIDTGVDFFISPIVIAEIYHGAKPKEHRQTTYAFISFSIFPIGLLSLFPLSKIYAYIGT